MKTTQEWAGTPPSTTSILDKGDEAFETTRARAQLAAEQAMREINTRRSEEDSLKRIHEIRHGHRVKGVLLEDMWKQWREKDDRKLAPKWESSIKAATVRFVALVRSLQPFAREMADVSEETASKFAKLEIAAYAPRTARHHILHVRSMFKVLRRTASLAFNPFVDVTVPDGKSIHRRPYTKEQLEAIKAASTRTWVYRKVTKSHAFIYRAVITSLCTCLRQADCCRLRWADVNLAANRITVIPEKTEDDIDEPVRIPILPLLRPILDKAWAEKKPDAVFVFPDLAEMYSDNPDGIIWRTELLLKAAGIEAAREKHTTGKRSVNRTGFSALRTTFVTLCLSHGIPEETLRKITGHATVDIVRKYYFQPADEDVSRELKKLGSTFETGSTSGAAPKSV